jgi:phosphoglycerate dehydrogenase-like enzyme
VQQRRLAGAVLDALPQEPLPPESPLWAVPNLIITAHCGVYDPTAYSERCLEGFFANLRRYRAGEPLEHLVDLARGY